MVEDRVLGPGEGAEVGQQGPGVDGCRGAGHQAVGLLYHGTHVQVVTVVEEVLSREDGGTGRERGDAETFFIFKNQLKTDLFRQAFS